MLSVERWIYGYHESMPMIGRQIETHLPFTSKQQRFHFGFQAALDIVLTMIDTFVRGYAKLGD